VRTLADDAPRESEPWWNYYYVVKYLGGEPAQRMRSRRAPPFRVGYTYGAFPRRILRAYATQWARTSSGSSPDAETLRP
jgi:hypothetical protein